MCLKILCEEWNLTLTSWRRVPNILGMGSVGNLCTLQPFKCCITMINRSKFVWCFFFLVQIFDKYVYCLLCYCWGPSADCMVYGNVHRCLDKFLGPSGKQQIVKFCIQKMINMKLHCTISFPVCSLLFLLVCRMKMSTNMTFYVHVHCICVHALNWKSYIILIMGKYCTM